MAKNLNSQITNKDLNEAVDAILTGMDKIILETRKGFNKITENFATKEDLKREIGWARDDVNGLKGELSNTVSRQKFIKLKTKVDKYLVD